MTSPEIPMAREVRPARPYRVSYRVKDVPSQQRPREQFDRLGAAGVSDETLLAIILRSGVPGSNVMDLARELLRAHSSLNGLASASPTELKRFKGMGPVKVQVLLAALELARRLSSEKASDRPLMDSPRDVAVLLRDEARTHETEVLWLLMLDARNALARPPHVVSTGIINGTLVHPREIFKEAIRHSANAIIIAHNHPSGDPSPSADDLRVTEQVIESGRIVGIDVLDHVVIGRETNTSDDSWWLSIREAGLVNFIPPTR